MEHHEDSMSPTPQERRGLALSALLISLVSLFCAFNTGWRDFSLVLALLGTVLAVWMMSRSPRGARSRRMAGFALLFALTGGIVSSWYFFNRAAEKENAVIPQELRDSASVPPDDETMERLRMSMDSTQAPSDGTHGH